MGMLDWLFGRRTDGDRTDELLTRALDRTIEVVEPKLALARDWRTRLRPGVEAAVELARSSAMRLQDFHEASEVAWGSDPVIRALFATAADVTQVLKRSSDLQRHFRTGGAGDEAYAVLGADFEAKRVLGATLDGDRVRQDAAMTQARFGGQHIRIVAATPELLQRATGVRIFNQMLIAATRRLAEVDRQREDANVTRALLQARLRMLDANESTLEPMVGYDGEAAADPAVEHAEIERQLAAMTAATESLGAGVQGIDTKLEIVRDALLEATQSLRIEPKQIRLDAVNTVLDENAQGGAAIAFLQITTREFSRAYVGIHVRRADVPAGGLAFADAERTLW
jgi:hypothetical protein